MTDFAFPFFFNYPPYFTCASSIIVTINICVCHILLLCLIM